MQIIILLTCLRINEPQIKRLPEYAVNFTSRTYTSNQPDAKYNRKELSCLIQATADRSPQVDASAAPRTRDWYPDVTYEFAEVSTKTGRTGILLGRKYGRRNKLAKFTNCRGMAPTAQ